jgi:mRNA interferase HigB
MYTSCMNVIAPRTLRAFWEKHDQAEGPLKEWQKGMQKGDFASLNDLRAVWPHADLAQTKENVPVIIFNIGGNKYRLVVNVNWTYKTIFVKRIMTHAEYDAWNREGRPL